MCARAHTIQAMASSNDFMGHSNASTSGQLTSDTGEGNQLGTDLFICLRQSKIPVFASQRQLEFPARSAVNSTDGKRLFHGDLPRKWSVRKHVSSTVLSWFNGNWKVRRWISGTERHPARKIAASCGEGLSHMSKIGKMGVSSSKLVKPLTFRDFGLR